MLGLTTHNEQHDRELPMPAMFARRFLLEEAASAGRPTFVWRAEEIATRRRVALTFFPAAWLDTPRGLAGAEELVVAMQVLNHPGVVVPVEVVAGQRWSAFVSPWIDGPTLHHMRAARPARRFEIEEIRPWLRTLLAALEAVHARGFVHGGLNPGLVIQQGSRLCIANAGVSAWLERAAERHDVRIPDDADRSYRSSSRRRGDAPGAADDIHALGAILFEQLTGVCPEPGRRWAGRPRQGFIQKERRRIGTAGEEVPVSWERAIWRCLAPNDRDRPGSVGELRIRLDLGAAETLPVPAAATPSVPQTTGVVRPVVTVRASPHVDEEPARPRPRSHWGLRGTVAVIALATIAVAGAFVWQQAQQYYDEPVVPTGTPTGRLRPDR